MPTRRKIAAHVLPMFVFALFLGVMELLHKVGNNVWFSRAEFWIYPVQTMACGLLVFVFWKEYEWAWPRRALAAIAIGIAVFVLWISPQIFFGAAPRTTGFNPDIFATQPSLYWATVIFRFLRLVVVVPLIEEIFWRGFLLRYLIDENFERVPFGSFSWLSFLIVAAAFGFSHSPADWIAALVTGMVYNFVAYYTRSLASCVITHAITNLLLGLWIIHTAQWGFW